MALSFAARLPLRQPRRNDAAAVTLVCREWERLSVDKDGLTEPEVERFHALAKRAAKRLRLPETAVLTRIHRRGLKAGQVVGVLAAPGRNLEILPKIDGEDGAVREALVRMLALAWELRVNEGELTALDTQRHDLLELLIRLFADRLLAAVRRGLPRLYLTQEEDLRLLCGRLDIKRQTTHLAVRPDRLACRFDELSEDTPLNRVLKASVSRLVRVARSAANTRSLAELTARFESVSDSPDPLHETVRLDRTNAAFHDLHRLACLFLAGDWQSTASGEAAGFALLFPMNELFEAFVGRSLKRALAPCPVHLQHRGRHALAGADGRRLFALRPDAVIEAADGPIVLDAKWKPLEPGDETLGIAQSDIYQLLAYRQAYGAARLILLYPWHSGSDGRDGIERRWTVSGTDCPFDVATVDVGRPGDAAETLRRIVELERPAAAVAARAPGTRASGPQLRAGRPRTQDGPPGPLL